VIVGDLDLATRQVVDFFGEGNKSGRRLSYCHRWCLVQQGRPITHVVSSDCAIGCQHVQFLKLGHYRDRRLPPSPFSLASAF